MAGEGPDQNGKGSLSTEAMNTEGSPASGASTEVSTPTGAKPTAMTAAYSEGLMKEQKRLTIETWIRGIALLIVVVAIVTYPMFALIFGTEGSRLSELIAPITGIAGAIVGYWFGQASRRISNTDNNGSGTQS